jgi:hypothetical protein
VAVSTRLGPGAGVVLRRELEGVVGLEQPIVALRLARSAAIHAGGSTEGVDWVARIEAHLDDVQPSAVGVAG